MNSKSAQILYDTGNQLKDAGKLDEAIASYQKALELQPDFVEALNQLGVAHFVQGRLSEAIAATQQALKLKPDFAEAYKTLGNVLQTQGKHEAAMRAYSKAIEINPDFAEAHANLGSMFYQQGRLDEAIASYRRAVAINPDLAGVYWNLGNVLNQLGRINEAIAYWQRALALKPDLGGAEFRFKLGNALAVLGKFDEAIENYDRAIALKPDLAEARAHLGLALLRRGDRQRQISGDQLNLAINSLLKAIEIKPDLVSAHKGLWDLLVTLGTDEKHFAPLRKMADRYLQVAGETGEIIATAAVINTYLKSGLNQLAGNKFAELEAKLYKESEKLSQSYLAAIYSSILFSAPHLRDDIEANAKLFKLIAKPYCQSIVQLVNPNQTKPANYLGKAIDKEKPLKIGFLSKHFRRHSVGWCSADAIGELSNLTPHIYLYLTEKINPDDITNKLTQSTAKLYQPKQQNFVDSSVDAGEIIEEILKDQIDILVDLDSITVPIQPAILYTKPAAVCISWLGFEPAFISEGNYFLGDWHTHPADTEKNYTEQLVRMPDSFVAISGFESKPVDREAVRKSMRIGSDQVVYLCVSAASKLSSELIAAQVKILKQVPDAVLIHKGLGDAEVIGSVYKQACESEGVGFYRVKFLGRSPTEEEHRTTYKIADVLLDSYPYNGGTHNLEALWFNLPVVTRTGEQALARMGYSLLKTLDIEAGIAHSWEEYIEWGVRFGKDAQLRNGIREQLVKSKQPEYLSPLWNPQKFAKDMYGVFEELLARKV